MNSGIYCIKNTLNNKCYVGQSIELSSRLSHHQTSLKKNKHRNKALQKDFNLYSDLFEITVIEKVENSLNLANILNEKEIFWIKELEAFTFGYNKTPGGRNTFGFWSKKFQWINLNTKEIIEASCSEMANLLEVSSGGFRSIINGKSLYNFHWTLEKKYDDVIKIWEKTRGRKNSFKNTITGEVIKDITPVNFAKKIGALRSDVYSLINQKTFSLKNWRLIDSEGVFIVKEKYLSKYSLTVRNIKTGEVLSNINKRIFCVQNNVSEQKLRNVIYSEKTKAVDGWEILEIARS